MAGRSERALIPALGFWREKSGLKKGELADIVGLSASMVTQLEHGQKGAGLHTLVRLAKALGCTIEQLMMPDPYNPPPVPELDRFLTDVAPDDITSEEIAILRAVALPGRRMTVRSYANLFDAIRNAEKLHS